jgi:hypothetical protein
MLAGFPDAEFAARKRVRPSELRLSALSPALAVRRAGSVVHVRLTLADIAPLSGYYPGRH